MTYKRTDFKKYLKISVKFTNVFVEIFDEYKQTLMEKFDGNIQILSQEKFTLFDTPGAIPPPPTWSQSWTSFCLIFSQRSLLVF